MTRNLWIWLFLLFMCLIWIGTAYIILKTPPPTPKPLVYTYRYITSSTAPTTSTASTTSTYTSSTSTIIHAKASCQSADYLTINASSLVLIDGEGLEIMGCGFAPYSVVFIVSDRYSQISQVTPDSSGSFNIKSYYFYNKTSVTPLAAAIQNGEVQNNTIHISAQIGYGYNYSNAVRIHLMGG